MRDTRAVEEDTTRPDHYDCEWQQRRQLWAYETTREKQRDNYEPGANACEKEKNLHAKADGGSTIEGWNEDKVRDTHESNSPQYPALCHEEQDDKDSLLSKTTSEREEQTPIPDTETTSDRSIERPWLKKDDRPRFRNVKSRPVFFPASPEWSYLGSRDAPIVRDPRRFMGGLSDNTIYKQYSNDANPFP